MIKINQADNINNIVQPLTRADILRDRRNLGYKRSSRKATESHPIKVDSEFFRKLQEAWK